MEGGETRLNMTFVGIPSFYRCPICEDLNTLDADIAILGVPFDEGSGFRPGMRFGPRRIREMSLMYAPKASGARGYYDIETGRVFLDGELKGKRVWDCGDVDIIYTQPMQTYKNTTETVAKILSRGAFPVVLGGDHSITFPVVRAFSDSPLDVVVIDAHLDFTDSAAGVTHAGMNPLRRISELPNVRKIIHIGIRGIRNGKAVHEAAVARGNVVITAVDLRRRGVTPCLREAMPLGNTYVSVDIDGLDPSIAPGCSGREPGGIGYPEAKEILATVTENATVIGFDINEVNPMLDIGDMTSGLAVQLTLEFLGMLTSSQGWKGRK